MNDNPIADDSELYEKLAQLTPDQSLAFDSIEAWHRRRPGKGKVHIWRLGGYAGTGKTFMLRALSLYLRHLEVAYCAPTGKAARVLQSNLPPHIGARATTMHRLLYRPVTDSKGRIIGWARRDFEADIVVVDEASMVTEALYNDLLERGVPVLFIGDHGQLPAFDGFELMASAEIKLETIMRQALDSPIVRLATQIRNEGYLPHLTALPEDTPEVEGCWQYPYANRQLRTRFAAGRKVAPYSAQTVQWEAGTFDGLETPSMPEVYPIEGPDHAFLCYTNAMRGSFNRLVRAQKGFTPREQSDAPYIRKDQIPVQAGDSVICLRNYYKQGPEFLNGSMFWVTETGNATLNGFEARLVDETGTETYANLDISHLNFGRPKTLKAEDGFFRSPADIGMLFDYGYALTVHKAQGSAFDYVTICYERPGVVNSDDFARWLYTAVTRARRQVVVLR